MKNHATATRARVAFGVTIPMGNTYGSVRVDVAFEDHARGTESALAVRKRVRATALRDLTREVRRALKRYNLDSAGQPRQGGTTWA